MSKKNSIKSDLEKLPDELRALESFVGTPEEKAKKTARLYETVKKKVAAAEAEVAILEGKKRELVDGFGKFTETEMSQGPHGVVLAYTQMVDNELTKIIQGNMPSLDKHTKETLFSGTGGLSTFSARIYVAKALALIEPKLAAELHKLRKFRNKFAHSDKVLTFDDKEVLGMVQGFDGVNPDFRSLGPQATFSGAIAMILVELRGGSRVRQRSEAGDVQLSD